MLQRTLKDAQTSYSTYRGGRNITIKRIPQNIRTPTPFNNAFTVTGKVIEMLTTRQPLPDASIVIKAPHITHNYRRRRLTLPP